MPLSMVSEGSEVEVARITGKTETRKHLENLGFVQGAKVKVLSEVNGDLIGVVKGVRVAIGKDMANKIMI